MLKRFGKSPFEEDEISLSGDSSSSEELNTTSNASKKNKVLILTSKGITSRQRKLMNELCTILPHSRKGIYRKLTILENKFDSKSDLYELDELAELDDCTHCVFLEPRKPGELFLWMSKCFTGPSIRFHVRDIVTAEDLGSVGNFYVGSRPLLSFDPNFALLQSGDIIQKTLVDIFNVPLGHRRGDRLKFFDHIIHFCIVESRIHFRCYQILEATNDSFSIDGLSLCEIGPRFVLDPVKIFSGSFKGPVVWSNSSFISPAQLRSQLNKKNKSKYANRKSAQTLNQNRKKDSQIKTRVYGFIED